MCLPSLRVAAARYALYRASGEDLVDAAHDALNRGFYSFSLGELATIRNPIWADVAPLFETAIIELGMPALSNEDALACLRKHNVRSIIEGTVSPQEGLCRLVSENSYYDNKMRHYVSDIRGIERLLDAYDLYDEYHVYTGLAPIESVDSEAFDVVAAWHRENCLPKIDPRWITSSVVDLARVVADQKAFDRLPILADALMDAGCDNEEIIEHLNYERHVRACWVVEMLLASG